jgi:glycosyltransferase involved in cell wall biosynthesis
LQRFDPNRKQDQSLRTQLGLHPTWPIILVVNRNFQDPQKGYDMVEEALRGLAPGNLQVVLVGQQSSWAAARLPHHCLAIDYVRCPEQLAHYYNAADYFLFASPAETFPCVVLEAMAAACCVISTPTNGVLEQIENGHTGWIAAEMSGASLGAALQEALSRPELSRKLGLAACSEAAEQFSEARMVERYLSLYEEIIQNQSCPSADTSPLTTALAR